MEIYLFPAAGGSKVFDSIKEMIMSMAGSAFRRVLTVSSSVGIVALLSLAGAQAQTSHHRGHAWPLDRDFNADASLNAQPRAPIVGTWRYDLLRHGCDRGYPMLQGNCGTATGGPVGGLGS